MIFQAYLFRGSIEENENILYIAHKHWIRFLANSFQLILLGIIMPWGLYLILTSPAMFWIATIISVVVYGKISIIFLDWFYDAILITQNSVVFVEWDGLFHRKSTRIALSGIESIEVESKGFWTYVFNYSSVSIEHSDGNPIHMPHIRNAKKLEKNIVKFQHELTNRTTHENTEALKDILSSLVKDHIQKHGWRQ